MAIADFLRRRWRRLVAACFTIAALVGAVLAYQPLWAFDVLAYVCPRLLWRVDTRAQLVALTFDDGPAPDHTPEVLSILARHGARATFFMIGDRAAAYPELVGDIRRAGHEIGNHYYTIRSTRRDSDEEFLANLLRAEQVLGLRERKLFRPPGGIARSSQLELASANGYTSVLGSAYPYDPLHPPSAYIRWLIAKNLAPGVIVILHDGIAEPSNSIAALEGILVAGHQKGLRFVTVGDLLEAGAQEEPRGRRTKS
jgi:peptidoglycan/xylan/chitin deacetylase (PgdA/CDA1 family)